MSLFSVIVTGGFLRRGDRPDAISTDSAALEGARCAADRRGVDLRTPLLYTLDPSRMSRLPVYLRTLNVHAVSENGLPGLIRDHLRHVKHRQDDPMSPTLPRQAGSAPDMPSPDLAASGSESDASE